MFTVATRMTEEIKEPSKEPEVVDREVADGEAAPRYTPPLQTKRKRRKKQKPPVGVGGLLDYARIKFTHGEYEIEQDANGQYKIGEEELSFESWGQMIRTKDDGVYATQIAIPRQRMRKPRLIYDEDKTNGKASKKKRTDTVEKTAEEKEKDEGELSDSAQSSSSSSDSESGYSHHKRHKRRKATANMDMAEIFAKSFQHRQVIVQHMNLTQKIAFFELLSSSSNPSDF